MSKQQQQGDRVSRSVRMVRLARIVQLLGGPVRVGLDPANFDGPPATEPQLAALAKWRVAAPLDTPLMVAGKLIAVLIERSQRNLAAPWQLNKLHTEYGYSITHITILSYDDAMRLIDREQKARGEGRFRYRRAGKPSGDR